MNHKKLLVIVDGKARGIIARNLVNGEIERHSAHAVVIASGGYGNVFFLSTNAMGSNVSAGWKKVATFGLRRRDFVSGLASKTCLQFLRTWLPCHAHSSQAGVRHVAVGGDHVGILCFVVSHRRLWTPSLGVHRRRRVQLHHNLVQAYSRLVEPRLDHNPAGSACCWGSQFFDYWSHESSAGEHEACDHLQPIRGHFVY